MGAAFSGYIGDFIQSQFWGQGSYVEEQGGGGDELWEDKLTRDHSWAAMQVFDVVFVPCPSTVDYGVPRLDMILKQINRRTRQRSIHIEITLPLLSTDPLPVRLDGGAVVWDGKHRPPTYEVLPVIKTEAYQKIVVYALPYQSIIFQVNKIQIAAVTPYWNSRSRKYSLQVYFRGPDNTVARYKVPEEPAFPNMYLLPPP